MASLPETDEIRDVLLLAEKWLCNCVPVSHIKGPTPLPAIRALLDRLKPSPMSPKLSDALSDCLDVIEPLRDELQKQGRWDAAKCCDEVIAYSRTALRAMSGQRITQDQRLR